MGDYGKECDADSANQTNQRHFGVLTKSSERFAEYFCGVRLEKV